MAARTRAYTASTISRSARSLRKPASGPRIGSGSATTMSALTRVPRRDSAKPASRSREVADAPDVEHERAVAVRLQLAAQARGMRVQRARSSERAEVPHFAQQLLLRE